MLAIYKREVKSFFTSLTAYVFIAIYLVIFGRYFKLYNLDAGMTTIGYPMLASYWVYFLFSLLTMKSVTARRLLCGKPCFLIREGRICQREMRRCRFTVDELTEELRGKDVSDPATVRFRIRPNKVHLFDPQTGERIRFRTK